MNQQDTFHDDRARGRFELSVHGETAYAMYRRETERLVIDFVYAPPALRGTGAADRLMREVALVARAEALPILARCGYARAWLRAHPEHRDLLAG